MPRKKKSVQLSANNDVKNSVVTTPPLDIVIITAGLVLLIVLLYKLEQMLSPILVFGVIIALLYPLRENRAAKNIMILSGLLFVLWFFYKVEEILAPFLLSLFFAYLLHPVVTRLETSWKIPRWTSAIFIICCVIAIVIVLLVLGLPHIVSQFEGILQAIGTISNQFVVWVLDGRFIKAIEKYGVSAEQLRQMLTTTIAPRVEDILKGLLKGTFGIVSGLQVIVSGIVNIVIIPFLTFFLLKDFPLVRKRIKLMIPKKQREHSIQFYHRVDEILGRYIRGILSGLLFFVPYFGFITILSVSAFVASLSMGTLALPVISTVSFLAVLHIIEVYVLTPMFIGEKIGLHPVVLILSLFLFGYFLGFIGLLISIPAAAIIIVSVKEWEANRRKEVKQESEK
jgi:predicted PurR-regulated permease PerM